MGSKVYSVRVPEDLANAIDKHCSEQGINSAQMLRKLAKEHVHPQEQGDVLEEGKTLVNVPDNKANASEPIESEQRQDFEQELNDIKVSIGCIDEALKALTDSVGDLCQRVATLEEKGILANNQEKKQSALSFLFNDD